MRNSDLAFYLYKLTAGAKTIGLIILTLFVQHTLNAQQNLFYEGFETRTWSSAWQPVSGNWHIASVQDLRIAPAEKGKEFVLSSDSAGFIRLIVDIPDSIRSKQVQLSFSYYTYSKIPAAFIEVEFHKKDLKDGLKGRLWTALLPVNKRWVDFKKTFAVPAGANLVWLSFSLAGRSLNPSRPVCFDNIKISSVR